jgi:queuine tRNA-ribosyltransferase
MFDCVLPTRNGRNAYAFTAAGPIRLRNSRFTSDPGPIEEGCDCPVCTRHSAAYLHHLFKVGDLSAERLATLHNLRFYVRLFENLRLDA